MRIRTIKPEFWTHEGLSSCSEFAHLLAAALLNYADDQGYFNAHPRLIQSALFPLRDTSLSIQCALTELLNVGFLEFRCAPDGRCYGKVVNFTVHQRINRPVRSKIADLWPIMESSLHTHTQLTEPSLTEGNREGNREGDKEQGTGNRDIVRSAQPDLNLAESIYAAYPRKVAKPAALRAITSALKTTSAADLLAKTTAYAEAVASWPDADAKFVPHPATWYNQQRYLDDPSEWRRGNTVAKTKYDDMEGKRW